MDVESAKNKICEIFSKCQKTSDPKTEESFFL